MITKVWWGADLGEEVQRARFSCQRLLIDDYFSIEEIGCTKICCSPIIATELQISLGEGTNWL